MVANGTTIEVGARGAYTQTVYVAVQTQKRLPFTSLVMDSTPVIEARATAAVGNPAKFCVVALEDRVVTGISAGGSTQLTLGCGMMSNSASPTDAVDFYGNATVVADPVAAVGGIDDGKNDSITKLENQPVLSDPYNYLPNPDTAGMNCDNKLSNKNGETTNIGPGCWESWDIKGTLNLAPGVYYIAGGSIGSNAGAKIVGREVTIIFTTKGNTGDVATVDANGQAYFDLTASKTGPYAGILMYQDPDATSSGTNKINGGSGGLLSGAVYFPKQEVTINGNADFTTECFRLVSRKVTFIGNSNITNNCPKDANVKDITAGGLDGVRLVE